MSGNAQALFISYASQDAEAASRICQALRAAGIEVWFDQRELRGGDAWDAAIRKQVKECSLFVPLISANTDARSEGYFRREWNLAVHRMLDMAEDQPFLLPVVIDETPEAMARVPDRFRERQWTRLVSGVAPAEFVERVMRLLAGDRVTAPAAPLRAVTFTPNDPARANEGFGVAVLPFKYRGANGDLTILAEALSEEIVTGLSRYSYLRVLAHGATARYASGTADVRTIAKEIGPRYVIEGSLQQAGASLRVAAQLVDATSGAHLWAETYTEAFDPDRMFALQDELVARIVSTCGDRFGVLARSISDVVRTREPSELSPYEALMRGFGYHHRLSPADHAQAREALERAVILSPANADCWAMLSWIYSHEHAHGLNVRPGSLERALAAARRAVDLGPSNQLAQQALAVVLFFRKERTGCLSAAERALALNPLDGSNETMFLLCFTGHWERDCSLIRRAMQINPYHPRWYGLVLAMSEYRTANYRAAVDEIVRANATDLFWTNMLLAAAYGELGELPAATNSLRDLLTQKEDFADIAQEFLTKWFEPQFVGQMMGGLRKAPSHGDAWAMLAFLCVQDYAQGFDLQADSMSRGLAAAHRAVEAAPSNHLAYCALAQALFHHKEFESFRNAAERCVALNPMDGHSIAFLGEMLAYAGDSARGLALSARAKQLNPHHPGWYWYADFYNTYRNGDDRGALGFALKVNLPSHWAMYAALSAAYGQLRETAAATKAVHDLLRVRPDFAAAGRNDIEKWWQPDYVAHLIDGWRKAGLELAPVKAA